MFSSCKLTLPTHKGDGSSEVWEKARAGIRCMIPFLIPPPLSSRPNSVQLWGNCLGLWGALSEVRCLRATMVLQHGHWAVPLSVFSTLSPEKCSHSFLGSSLCPQGQLTFWHLGMLNDICSIEQKGGPWFFARQVFPLSLDSWKPLSSLRTQGWGGATSRK